MSGKGKSVSVLNKQTDKKLRDFFREAAGIYMPGVSLNIVVFNYGNGKLKVLVMRLADSDFHMLPGGYIMNDEDLDDAALRVFHEWTGFRHILLDQFYTSGKADRVSNSLISNIIRKTHNLEADPWFDQRKITVCYFALLHEHEINPVKIDFPAGDFKWVSINDVPPLQFDHNHIIEKAIQKLQENLDHILATRPLFTKEFTMGELQKLYEAIFLKGFTRTNFQRRMLNLGILERIGKQYNGKAHKAPYLYRFRNIN